MKNILLISLNILFFIGCENDINKKGADTATYGTIRIASDESFQPIVDAELDIFRAFYTHATLNIEYKPEDAAFELLLKDSVRLIFASRTLNDYEKSVFEKVKIIPRINKVAIDGVALVTNNANPDSLLTMNQLKAIFNGMTINWKLINKNNAFGDIKIVFDNGSSSNLRYVVDKFGCDSIARKRFFSANGNEAVVEYVKENKGAIGVIGVNWISDGDDSTSKSFNKSIKVVSIAEKDDAKKSEYYQPYQAYLAQGWYPLSRDLYIISREARVGLGTGFAAFVLSERGQRIVLKSGLVPANVPLRIISLKNKKI
ncbi:MAG: PstS family phosphate ABC transporter substrate-binding protein [Cytophagales bacterium]